MPHLLIACAAWHAADYIEDAIGSALAAPVPHGWTRSCIVGVDGCEPTLSAARMARSRHPEITVVDFPKADCYRVRNAIATIGGAWDAMGIIDADDLYLYNRWTATLPLLDSACVVSGQSIFLSRTLTPDVPVEEMPAGWEGNRRWVGLRSFTHPAAVIRRDVWDALGGYANDWPCGSDSHFIGRARDWGTTARIPQVVVMQRTHTEQITSKISYLSEERKKISAEIREAIASRRDGKRIPVIPRHIYQPRQT